MEQRVQTFPVAGKKGVWQQLFTELGENPDLEYLIIDSSIVRAHHHVAGAQKAGSEDEAIGRSRGGLSTKISIAVDGLGNPVRFILTAVQVGISARKRA